MARDNEVEPLAALSEDQIIAIDIEKPAFPRKALLVIRINTKFPRS